MSYYQNSGNPVAEIYKTVIQDVINQVKESFLDENIDIDTLSQLKKEWEEKVNSSGCVDLEPRPQQMHPQHPVPPPPMRAPNMAGPPRMNIPIARVPQPGPPNVQQLIQGGHHGHQIGIPMDQRQQQIQMPYIQQSMAQIPIQPNHLGVPAGVNFPQGMRMVQAVGPGGQPFMQQQPMMFIQQNGQQIPIAMAPNQILQGRVQPQLHQQMPHQLDGNSRQEFVDSDEEGPDTVCSSRQLDKPKTKKKTLKKRPTKEEAEEVIRSLLIQLQLDGGGGGMSDSSSEEEEEDNDPLRRIADKIGGDGAVDEAETVLEEDPLNSEDDQSDDEDLETIFDADNVIMCLFEKVHRARSKWKFQLKDGIMHINNKDYCFQKCTGDAEW